MKKMESVTMSALIRRDMSRKRDSISGKKNRWMKEMNRRTKQERIR